MGRGRAKAKQTKVARALKYGGPETDFERLQRELAGNADSAEVAGDEVDDDDEDESDDPYAKYYEEDESDEPQQHSA